MKRWMMAGCVVLGLSACGGGGDGDGDVANGQTPFEFVISESRAQPLEQSCRSSAHATAPLESAPPPPEPPPVVVVSAAAATGTAYGVRDETEVRATASGRTIEVFEREAFHSAADCTGPALVSTQVKANIEQVPVVRINYLSTLRSAQVRMLDGSTINTVVDRVEATVNPGSGVVDFEFLSPAVAGSQQKQGFTTTATFTINGVTVMQTQELMSPMTSVVGLARLNGVIVNLMPVSEGVFQEVAD